MTANAPVRFRTFGSGSRPALAIHCTLSHAGAWRGVGAVLGEVFALRAFDLPGHGVNPIGKEDAEAHDLATCWAVEGLTAQMDLIGHSFGAVVALRVALEQPHLVRSLTLIEPVLFAAAKASDRPLFDAYLQHSEPYVAALKAGDMQVAARLFNRIWGDGRKWDDFPDRTRSYMIDRVHVVASQDKVLIKDELELLAPGRLEALAVPVLLLEGADSPPIIGAIQKSLAARLPVVTRAMVAGAGHMLPITHSEAVGREIRAFSEVT